MIIEYLKIKKFRSFEKDTIIPLSKNITVIAGQNGTSKSTLLGMLAQPFQFEELLKNENLSDKDKEQLSSFAGMIPQSVFSDIFNLSPVKDLPSDNNIYEYCIKINKDILYPQTKESFEKYGQITEITTKTSRSRLTKLKNKYGSIDKIPKDELTNPSLIRLVTGSRHEPGFGKIDNIPTIYLGLSRLYPLGEIDKKESLTKIHANISEEEEFFLKQDHDNILMVSHENNGRSNISTINSNLKSYVKNNTLTFENDIYDGWANSMGEDSLLTILKAILYFKRIYEITKRNKLKYKGGLLLIDEIDASLYPAAQRNLYNKLLYYSRKYNIQIVFTTHSESLLNYIYKKHNGNNIIFLRKEDNIVKVKNGISFTTMKTYLSLEDDPIGIPDENKKIVVFREDKETENFLKVILGRRITKKLKFIEGSLSCRQVSDLSKSLHKSDLPSIFLVDADTNEDLKKSLIGLPGKYCPEEELIKCMMEEYSNTEIEELLSINYQKYFGNFNYSLNINQKQKTDMCKDKYKEFTKNKIFGNQPYSKGFNLWIDKHKSEVEKFKIKFCKLYNQEAKKIGVDLIKIPEPTAIEEAAATLQNKDTYH